MAERSINRSEFTNILNLIKEGMAVMDQNGDRLGTVETLYFGETGVDPFQSGTESETVNDPNIIDQGFVKDFAEALTGTDDIPDVLRNRLLHDGYIKIHSGGLLFSGHRYAMRDQISTVDGDRVILKVDKDQLIKI